MEVETPQMCGSPPKQGWGGSSQCTVVDGAVSKADPPCWLAGGVEEQGDEAADQREFFK